MNQQKSAHAKNSTHSTLRERIIEHTFVADALRLLWVRDIVDVEVLRPEFDAHGYDIAMVRGKIVRHIQLKTGTSKRPGDVSAGLALADKPSGCVIWIRITSDLRMGPFFWFGGRPGKPLPDISAFNVPLRATHNRTQVRPPRVNHRLIPKRNFEELATIEDVLAKLFGNIPS